MKINIITEVWVGEFDESEFPRYVSHTIEGNVVTVTETIELGIGQRIEIIGED